MCWLWFHVWTGWEIAERADLKSDGKKIGAVLTQHRRCRRCGFTQLKMETAYAK